MLTVLASRQHTSEAKPTLLQLHIPSTEPSAQVDLPTKKKDKRRVPSSGRGGLGNIRAKQSEPQTQSSSKGKGKGKAPHSPSSFRFRPGLAVTGRASFSSDSTSTLTASSRSVSGSSSSGTSIYSTISGTRTRSFSGRTLSLLNHEDEEPESPSIPSPGHHNSFQTFSSSMSSGSGPNVGTGTETSTAYASHLAADAQQRFSSKRAREERNLDAEQFNTGGNEEGGDMEEKLVRVRTGRGGAGVYKKVTVKVDPVTHPRAADITSEYEARSALLERSLLEASRARSAESGSTGRGGAGNIALASSGAFSSLVSNAKAKKKNVSSSKLEKMEKAAAGKVKGKGRAEAASASEGSGDGSGDGVEEEEGIALWRSRSPPTATGADPPKSEVEAEAKEAKKNLRGLWKRVTGSNSRSLTPGSPPTEDTGEVFEIGPVSQPTDDVKTDISPSYPLREATPTGSRRTKLRKQPSSQLNRQGHGAEHREREGAALLSLVNTTIPGLDSQRGAFGSSSSFNLPAFASAAAVKSPAADAETFRKNAELNLKLQSVRGVPGTPGFPMPVGWVHDSSLTNKPKAEAGRNAGAKVDTYGKLGDQEELKQVEVVAEEEWLDDSNPYSSRSDGAVDDDDDDDSDIDPQGHPSTFKSYHQQYQHSSRSVQISVPEDEIFQFDSQTRARNLDFLFRTALSRMDNATDPNEDGRTVYRAEWRESETTLGQNHGIVPASFSDAKRNSMRVQNPDDGDDAEDENEDDDELIVNHYALTASRRSDPAVSVSTPTPKASGTCGSFSIRPAISAKPQPVITSPPLHQRTNVPVIRSFHRGKATNVKVKHPGPPPMRPVPQLPNA